VNGYLREILRQRVRDGVLLRLIGKWLNAGVQEGGQISHPAAGTPQGGVISPLLANIYLHEVMDTWFDRTVKPRLRGQALLIRYALRRRPGDPVLGRGRCTPRHGCAAEAVRQVWTGAPPGQDPADRLSPPALPWWRWRLSIGDVRPARLHPPLGQEPPRELGGEAEDGQGSTESNPAGYRSVVPPQSPPTGCPAALRPEHEAPRSLRVLRCDRERVEPLGLAAAGRTDLAQVAVPPLTAWANIMGSHGSIARAVPTPATDPCTTLPCSRVAKPCLGEPDAVVPHVRVCRGPRAGNRPGLPARRPIQGY